MKIYTKTGDAGDTGLFGGSRVSKDDVRVEAYGDVDELNSAIGLYRAAVSSGQDRDDLDSLLADIQSRLFDLGAELATAEGRSREGMPSIEDAHVVELEDAIDLYEKPLAPLKAFVLPGGSQSAAFAHMARTVCRRAERRVVTLGQKAAVRGELLRYLNRLSDLLFVLARVENHVACVPDVPWLGRG